MLRLLISVYIVVMSIAVAVAEPTSQSGTIANLRVYSDGSVFVLMDSPVVCSTDTFKIEGSDSGSDKMYSTALAALLASKSVVIEVYNSTGCNGWGTQIQSIYIVN